MSSEKQTEHARPAGGSEQPALPEPSYAEKARTLVYLGRVGTLSTLSRRHPAWPFGSVMPYGLDASGAPTFLISTMAMHTQNLEGDPRASLLVTEPGASEDPLGAGRVTLMGKATRAPAAELESIRERYLERYDNARYWVDFKDFAFFRMQLEDVYFVGGFGVMGWVPAEDYSSAEPDPLADASQGIIEHMNADHVEAMLLLAAGLEGIDNVKGSDAKMTAVDRLGFHVRVTTPEGMKGLRIPFSREVRTGDETRRVLVEMVKEQRAKAES